MNDSQRIVDLYQRILTEISKVIIGKGEIERALVLSLIASGHVLIEGLPGPPRRSSHALSPKQSVGSSKGYSSHRT